MIPISICVIAKNEEKHMENFLSSIKQHFEGYPCELVIVDTGSIDKTAEIAKKYTNNVYYFEWIDDFSAARNYSVKKASHNWILVLDCDEYVLDVDFNGIQEIMEQHPQAVGTFIRRNTFHAGDGDSILIDRPERFFNRKYFLYVASIHEQIYPYDCRKDWERVALPLTTEHHGYDTSYEELCQKAERNNRLLFKMLEDYPPCAYVYFQLGQSYNMIGDSENACLYYEKALEFDIDPHSEYVRMLIVNYGHNLLKLKRYQDALQFQNIYNDFSYFVEFVCLMGDIYLENKMYLQAMTEFLKAITFETCETAGTNSYIPFAKMGYINELLGETEAAIALYKKCGDYPYALSRLKELHQI